METNGSGYVNVSGGLITSQFISSMQGESVGFDFARPETFRKLDEDNSVTLKNEDYNFEVREAFESLKQRWDRYSQNLKYISYDEFLKYWAKPFFDQFGFNITRTSKQFNITEKMKFIFSHRGWNPSAHLNPPVVHIIPYGHSFDQKMETNQPCPHDAVQAYLNMNEDNWALLFNERFLRFIRDFHHTTVKGYIEFDIEAIFTNRLYSDFQILYRFLHVSRFTLAKSGKKEEDEKPEIYLEEYFKNSQKAGEKVGEDLRTNVVDAIVGLGNGFLTNELREELKNNEQKCKVYYNEILKAIYRIIFLLYAEQRGLIGGHGGPGQDIYLENYSITALRKLAIEKEHDRYYQNDDHTDLWEGLLVTFGMIKDGVKDMGIYPYNGMLFDINETDYLATYRCKNSSFLKAIRSLTLIREGNISQIISYADLSVEEFGSVYESLLDYAPRITSTEEDIAGVKYPANSFILDPRGSDRKSTGSYYTNPQLVQQLIKSALEPVIEDRLRKVKSNDPLEKEKAILSIKVCDSASGSGAFLIAACNRLGKELAKIRAKDAIPTQDFEQNARRDVMLHCIYGVDVNPMAVELAKVSLWINAAVKNKPLNFLDHHIKCGNSLIGATPELMAKGIPSDAFEPVEGDDKKVASYFKKINNEQHKVRTLDSWQEERKDKSRICSAKFAALDNVDEPNPDYVHLKKQKYDELLANEIFHQEKFLANLWTSAFFWKLDDQNAKIPTQSVFLAAMKDISSVDPDIRTTVEDLTGKHRFFHWHVEFPDVFGKDDPGFDCVLGNPPWDMIKENSDEFFSYYDRNFRKQNSKEKKERIKELCTNSLIESKWLDYQSIFAHYTKYYQNSGVYQYQGKGHFNAFKIFTEKFHQLIGYGKNMGIIVPSGLYTDDGCSALRELLLYQSKIIELFCFENKNKIFPIHSSFKFVILTAAKLIKTDTFVTGFMLKDLSVLSKQRIDGLRISEKLISKFSPDTLSIMEFQDQKEIDLLNKIYNEFPMMGEKIDNTWNVVFHRELNQTDDHKLLQTSLSPIPIYEGKMIHHYKSNSENTRYWILENDAKEFYSKRGYEAWKYYRLAYRAVASSTNETTLISTIIPKHTGSVESLRIIELLEYNKKQNQYIESINDREQLFLTALLNSFVLNYVIRRKISANLSAFYLYQLPAPRYKQGNWYFDQVVARVARLVCTTVEYSDLWSKIYDPTWKNYSETENGTSSLKSWNNIGPIWDKNTGIIGTDDTNHDIGDRAKIRCEIDALVAHLYGLDENDIEYILSTFPIVKQKTPWLIDDTLIEYRRLKPYISSGKGVV